MDVLELLPRSRGAERRKLWARFVRTGWPYVTKPCMTIFIWDNFRHLTKIRSMPSCWNDFTILMKITKEKYQKENSRKCSMLKEWSANLSVRPRTERFCWSLNPWTISWTQLRIHSRPNHLHFKKGFDPSDEYLEEKMINFDKTGDTQLNYEEFKNLCQAVRLDHDVIDAETTTKNQICPRNAWK